MIVNGPLLTHSLTPGLFFGLHSLGVCTIKTIKIKHQRNILVIDFEQYYLLTGHNPLGHFRSLDSLVQAQLPHSAV